MLAAALLIPNLVVIVTGTEDFPFTTAPMFAHYVGPDTELYAFRFEGVNDGVSEPLPIEETNLGVVETQRRLVSWFYRPMTDTSPFRDLSGASDDRKAFESGMAGFFGPIVDDLQDRRSLSFDEVELYVDIVDSGGTPLESRLVGSYDPATRVYTQTYEAGR